MTVGRLWWRAALGALVLAASADGYAAPGPVVASDCGAAALRPLLIGAADTPDLRRAVAARVGVRVVRWLRPGTAVAGDQDQARLNVVLSDSGRVVALRCG